MTQGSDDRGYARRGRLGGRDAAVDLDALIWQWPPDSQWNTDLMFENLAAIWPNFERRGVSHLVLARVLEDHDELRRYQVAIPGAEIKVCLITAPEEQRRARLLQRMPPGPSLDWHLERTIELDAILLRLAYEDFTVENGDRSVREVAQDVLTRCGWI